jgi:hypothetical protein
MLDVFQGPEDSLLKGAVDSAVGGEQAGRGG